MKNFKKLFSLVVIATFLLSLAAPAFASDVNASIGRLAALGVVKGYDAAGTDYKPEQKITRAEYAAVAVRLLGLEAAEGAAKGGTKFKDVTSAHWASGYINLAVGNGIIKGYPDGSFKPEANVTYAEAFAMLVRVLGYDPVVKGTWPTNYIGKAAQLGLLDGVTLSDYNAAAARGSVFQGADNSLDEKVLVESGYDNAGKVTYSVDTKNLMEKRLSVKVWAKGTVNDVPNTNTALAKDQITISGVTTTKVAANVDPNAYYGLEVEAWEKDSKIFFLNVKTSSANILNDKIKEIDLVGNRVKLDKLDKWYNVTATTPKIQLNFVTRALNQLTAGQEVRLILNDKNEAAYVLASSYTVAMVKDVDASAEKINLDNNAGSIDLKNNTTTLLKNGKTVALTDLKKGDIVNYISEGKVRYVIASNAVATGKLTSVTEDGSKYILTVGGKDIKTVSASSLFTSTDNGAKYNAVASNKLTDFSSITNQEVKVLLDKGGNAVFVIAGAAGTSNEIIGLVKFAKAVDLGIIKRYIYITKADGVNTYYEVTKDSRIDSLKVDEAQLKLASPVVTNANGTVLKGMVIKFTLAADGATVDNMKLYKPTDIINDVASAEFVPNAAGITVDKNIDSIAIKNVANSTYAVNADTKIFKVKSYLTVTGTVTTETYLTVGNYGAINIDDAEMTNWSAVEALTSSLADAARVIIVKDGGIAKAVVIYTTGTTLASDFKYGMVLSKGLTGSDENYTVNGGASSTDNITAAIKSVVAPAPAKKNIVRYKLSSDNKLDSVENVAATTTVDANYAYFKIKKVDTANKQLEVVLSDVNGNEKASSTTFLFFDPIKTRAFDISAADGSISVITDLGTLTNYVVDVYNAFDKDGKDLKHNPTLTDNTIDYIAVVKK
ncbi:MAG: S-layer homology domain-containing protein [Thermincolia bacterium]